MAMSDTRILYIDDEVSLCDLVRACLGMEGYAISTAPSPRGGRGIRDPRDGGLRPHPLGLPHAKGGLDVLRVLREKGSATRVVVLSGDDGPEVARACKEFGVIARLGKPFDAAALLGILPD
jgi:DNA-binding NtrC family response regulator